MKCSNSEFNAQGSKLIIVVVHVGAVKIYVAAVEALRKEGMKLSLPPKLVEKLAIDFYFDCEIVVLCKEKENKNLLSSCW
jgi:hypothetical protein